MAYFKKEGQGGGDSLQLACPMLCYILAFTLTTLLWLALMRTVMRQLERARERRLRSQLKIAVEAVVNKISVLKTKAVELEVCANRDAALKSLRALELTVASTGGITPIAHNGCRPPKAKRV
ncbi:30S ribosomal protein S11 [Candidatus Hodgkinia cicadicola]|nr:30S ribosomal protein S11 [Candidatus Hodgkinia cicadicola]